MSKRIYILISLCLLCLPAFSQEKHYYTKEVQELAGDITASKFERTDKNGNACAIVKVAVPSVSSITCDEAVGDIMQTTGEYLIYLSPKTKRITVKERGESLATIDFDKFDVEILSKHTYRAVLGIAGEVVFHVELPNEAENIELFVDNEKVDLDKNGMGRINLTPGTHWYKASAVHCVEQAGHVEVGLTEELAVFIELELNSIQMTFSSPVKKYELIIDDEPRGTAKKGVLEVSDIPVGRRNIRIISPGYKELNLTPRLTEEYDKKTYPFNMKKDDDTGTKLRTRWDILLGGGMAFGFKSMTEMNEENLKGYPVSIGADAEIFIKRWFTIRPGVELTYFIGDGIKVEGESPLLIDVPVVFSINMPLGRLNTNHFSVGVGPVLGYSSWSANESNSDTKSEYMIGGRLEARLAFNHFLFGVHIDYQRYTKKMVAENGLLVPMVALGYRF